MKMPSKRVLEVSDEEALREIIASLGAARGVEVITASNRRDALKQYRKHGPFSFLLTDLYLGGGLDHRIPEPKDGLLLALEILKLNPEQKIIIHTATDPRNIRVPEGTPITIFQKPCLDKLILVVL
jgi:CheY-like chemotaxis protein